MGFLNKINRILIVVYFSLRKFIKTTSRKTDVVRIGFLVEEYFDDKFRGFGGYGMTVKYIAEHFNRKERSGLNAAVVLVHPLEIDQPECTIVNDVRVLAMPKKLAEQENGLFRYCSMIHDQNFNVFIGVDHFKTYEFPLMTFPTIPWVVWLKDPRDLSKWKKMSSVSLMNKYFGIADPNVYKQYCRNRFQSFRRVYERSKIFGRKIVIATEAYDFVGIGKNLFGLTELEPAFLAKPIPLPHMEGPEYSDKPSFLFLARLDPVKRPWVFCEIAKRFPQADFFIAGLSNKPELMDPVLARYKSIPNLKFLGRVLGPEKDVLFRKIWAVINTSVHEGLPVSIVEGFSYGKTAIASENPDGITAKYAHWVGEMQGDGYDEKTIDLYAQHVEVIIKGRFDREKLFKENREYIRTVHSFEKFESTIRDMVSTRKYDRNFTIDEKYRV